MGYKLGEAIGRFLLRKSPEIREVRRRVDEARNTRNRIKNLLFGTSKIELKFLLRDGPGATLLEIQREVYLSDNWGESRSFKSILTVKVPYDRRGNITVGCTSILSPPIPEKMRSSYSRSQVHIERCALEINHYMEVAFSGIGPDDKKPWSLPPLNSE